MGTLLSNDETTTPTNESRGPRLSRESLFETMTNVPQRNQTNRANESDGGLLATTEDEDLGLQRRTFSDVGEG